MAEDFGWAGDEFLLGDCQDDWQTYGADRFDTRKGERDLMDIRKRLLEEDEVDDEWDRINERDLSDIVREHDEQEDWLDEADEDYYDCDWEE